MGDSIDRLIFVISAVVAAAIWWWVRPARRPPHRRSDYEQRTVPRLIMGVVVCCAGALAVLAGIRIHTSLDFLWLVDHPNVQMAIGVALPFVFGGVFGVLVAALWEFAVASDRQPVVAVLVLAISACLALFVGLFNREVASLWRSLERVELAGVMLDVGNENRLPRLPFPANRNFTFNKKEDDMSVGFSMLVNTINKMHSDTIYIREFCSEFHPKFDCNINRYSGTDNNYDEFEKAMYGWESFANAVIPLIHCLENEVSSNNTAIRIQLRVLLENMLEDMSSDQITEIATDSWVFQRFFVALNDMTELTSRCVDLIDVKKIEYNDDVFNSRNNIIFNETNQENLFIYDFILNYIPRMQASLLAALGYTNLAVSILEYEWLKSTFKATEDSQINENAFPIYIWKSRIVEALAYINHHIGDSRSETAYLAKSVRIARNWLSSQLEVNAHSPLALTEACALKKLHPMGEHFAELSRQQTPSGDLAASDRTAAGLLGFDAYMAATTQSYLTQWLRVIHDNAADRATNVSVDDLQTAAEFARLASVEPSLFMQCLQNAGSPPIWGWIGRFDMMRTHALLHYARAAELNRSVALGRAGAIEQDLMHDHACAAGYALRDTEALGLDALAVLEDDDPAAEDMRSYLLENLRNARHLLAGLAPLTRDCERRLRW